MRELRPYRVSDIFTVVGMLSRLSKSNLKNILVADNKAGGEPTTQPQEERIGELIFDILSECWDCCESSLVDWFASLNNMTREQFLKDENLDIVTDTIEAIVTRKESRDFFSRAYARFRRMGGLLRATESD